MATEVPKPVPQALLDLAVAGLVDDIVSGAVVVFDE